MDTVPPALPWLTAVMVSVSPTSGANESLLSTLNVIGPPAAKVSSLAVGGSLTALTVMVAVTEEPPRPASLLLVEARTVKLPVPEKFGAGVNFRPAAPWATVRKLLLATAVVPLFRNREPLLMLVIL